MRGLPRRRLVLGRSVPTSVRGATSAGSGRIANATRIAPSPPTWPDANVLRGVGLAKNGLKKLSRFW